MYNFNESLSADEFELFCRDILAAEHNLNLRTFASGPDKGIDIKYSFIHNKNNWIGQCKNYKSLGLSTVQNEFDKIDKKDLERYFFMTSVELTDKKINDIYEIFKDYMESTEDIFGKIELNALLDKYPHILKKYYQLWIGSSNLLQSFLYAEDENYSAIRYNEIVFDTKSFIHTSYYEDLVEVLKKEHFCIVEGLPGVGKTTLSSVVLLGYMKDKVNCKFVYVKEISDIGKFMNESEEVVFLFDDFLGDYIYNKYVIDEKSISMLISIISIIKKSNNKRMILTTRKNIINKAKRENYKMRDKLFNNIITLDMGKLTLEDKIKIVSNSVNKLLIDSKIINYWTDSFIRKIARHKNFYPRLLTEVLNLDVIDSKNKFMYQNNIKTYFDHCEKIWEEVFSNKLSREAKILCYQLIFDKNQSYVKHNINFKKNYDLVYKRYCMAHNKPLKETPYMDAVIETESFVTNGKSNYLEFYDNSIRDYLNYFFNEHLDLLPFYFEENKILESPLQSKVLSQFSFSRYGSKIQLKAIENEIVYIIEKNINTYTLDDIYKIFRMSHELRLFPNSNLITTHVLKTLPSYNVDSSKIFSFYALHSYLKICKIFNYTIKNNIKNELIQVCKDCLEYGYMDLSDVESLIYFSSKYDCIDEFDSSLISYIIDDEFKSKDFTDLYVLQEVIDNCSDIANHFDLSSCSIATEIKDALEIIYEDIKKEGEEYTASLLGDIFNF